MNTEAADAGWLLSAVRDGRAITLILLAMALEALALMSIAARRSGWPLARSIGLTLLAGLMLMLALLLALRGAAPQALAACLVVALVVHVLDVGLRLR